MNKSKRAEEILTSQGQISNVKTLDGSYGFRTNRLAAIICNLRKKHNIETMKTRYDNGEYKDCIYIWRGRLPS